MTTRDLLIELGTEELPPKALPTLSSAFCSEVEAGLAQHNLAFSGITPYATPRRLAMIVHGLEERQPDIAVEKLGPALQAAFDEEGKPTKAAEGFARSCGVSVDELGRKEDGKVTKLFFQQQKAGVDTATLIPGVVNSALAKLPIPKRMRWGSSRDEFVRPVHWSVLLYGKEVLAATVLGTASAAETFGHRFHHPGSIPLSTPDDYAPVLEGKAFVIPGFAQRRETIRSLLTAQAEILKAEVIIDEALLDEVTALVEWPVALTGKFDESFLSVPQEALISSMKEHQKCFHLLDSSGKMLPHFITVSNLVSRDPAQVIAGNEKVIGPRLADAAFFFSQDKKQTLESRCEKLKTVVFQQSLGTVFEKSERVGKLAAYIAGNIGVDVAKSERAAKLGKCDLLTSMVYEFPELQGIMGTYYARADGEDEAVALSLNEQYQPRFSGDDLPGSKVGTVLALAERMDTIAGLFAIGQPPTGSKDPFALRRAALGCIRILVEKQLELNLVELITRAVTVQPVGTENTKALENEIYTFFIDRMRAWYAEQGITADTFQAVEVLRPASLKQFDLRLKAVSHFLTLPRAAALASANKRVANILSKLDAAPEGKISEALFTEPAESSLYQEMNSARSDVDQACSSQDYTAALQRLCAMQAGIDAFFTDVMVNVDDDAVRRNRQLLLSQLRALFLRVADISRLQLAGS